MIESISVEHVTFVSDRSFKDVVGAFEEQVGTLEEIGWPAIPAASRDQDDFERRVSEVLGPSGFTRFLTIDHGEWVSKQECPTRFLMYTIGNPLIAITMMRHAGPVDAVRNKPRRSSDRRANRLLLVG